MKRGLCKLWFCIWLCLCLICIPVPKQASAGEGASADRQVRIDSALLDSLRQGGYILYVRHGEATEGADLPNPDPEDCRTQRNLSARGREEAVRLGRTLKGLGIPVQFPVSASPLCRTRESAELAFGREHVRTDPFWIRIYRLGGEISAEEREVTLNRLAKRLETMPPPGANTVIVAHSFPEGTGLGDIPYMGTVAIRPAGAGQGYRIVGRIGLDQWAAR